MMIIIKREYHLNLLKPNKNLIRQRLVKILMIEEDRKKF